jgi:hypothetical protein
MLDDPPPWNPPPERVPCELPPKLEPPMLREGVEPPMLREGAEFPRYPPKFPLFERLSGRRSMPRLLS